MKGKWNNSFQKCASCVVEHLLCSMPGNRLFSLPTISVFFIFYWIPSPSLLLLLPPSVDMSLYCPLHPFLTVCDTVHKR